VDSFNRASIAKDRRAKRHFLDEENPRPNGNVFSYDPSFISIIDAARVAQMEESAEESMRRVVCTLLTSVLMTAATYLAAQGSPAAQKPATEPPNRARAGSQETLAFWNQIGKRLVDMAEDFPEDKYSFRAQKDERTFGENLVHVADEDYRLLSAIKGGPMGPAGGRELSFGDYKTKDSIVKLIKQVVADGAALLQEQGDGGLTREVKYPYGNFMVHGSTAWLDAIEHSAEHYGQLVVYYRVAGLVPPSSRPKK
jgi:uncharacterized damage-inducible protein DinB